MTFCRRPTVVALLVLGFLPRLYGRSNEYDARAHYNKFEHLIPMRDGVHLFTAVYIPKDRSRAYPILMTRTPYSVRPYGPDAYKSTLGPHAGFAEEGFIFVYQDVRGRFMSEGEFVNVRPFLASKKSSRDVDESSDTYDSIEWLLANLTNHNGRVGIYGTSYPGFYTVCGLIEGHPAIQAASPQASIGDWFLGDDWHHQGAFFLLDAFNFYSVIGQPRPAPSLKSPPRFEYPVQDAYQFFLELGPLSNVNARHFKGNIAFWNDLMGHGTYDAFWKERNIIQHLKGIRAAVLTVAGLFDAEDPYGPLKIYQKIESEEPDNPNMLVLGPWTHGGWNGMDGDSLGNVLFHVKTGEDFRTMASLPFFKHHLKEDGGLDLPEALVFVTGANAWHRFNEWPPADVETRSLFLLAKGRLALEPPEQLVDGFDEYLSDPANPVPYTSEVGLSRPNTYMVEDQRFAARRPDVLKYQSEVLRRDVTVVGPVTPELFVSSTGSDADYVVKLIDVYPDDAPEHDSKYMDVPMGGYQMLVRAEVMRARFRDSYESPRALTPGQIARVKFAMPDVAHTFKAGHRIMVQVQSSWFPLVDRNPQRFVDIYSAEEDDFQKAFQRVHFSKDHPSRLEILALQE